MAYLTHEAFERLRHVIQPITYRFDVKHLRRTLQVPELKTTNSQVDFVSFHKGKLLAGSKSCKKLFLYDPISLEHINTLNTEKVSQAMFSSSGNIVYTPSSHDKIGVLCPRTGDIIRETPMNRPHLLSTSYDNVMYLMSEKWVRHSSDGGMTWADYFKPSTDDDFEQMIKVSNDGSDVFWVITADKKLREYKVTLPDANIQTGSYDNNIDRQATWQDFKLMVPRDVWPQRALDVVLGAARCQGETRINTRDITLKSGGGDFVAVTHHFDKEFLENVYLYSTDEQKFIRLLLDGSSIRFALSVDIDVERKLLCFGGYNGTVHILLLDHWRDVVKEVLGESDIVKLDIIV